MNLLFLLSLPAAYAADCNDKNLCVGDQTWAFYGGQIHAGVVRSLQPDGKVDFQTNGEAKAVTIAPEKVAVVKAGACPPDSKACVGNQSIRGQGDQAVAGKVLGYFTNDFVVVSENGGAAASLPAKQFTSFTDKPCSADQRFCKDDLVFVNDGKALRLIKIDDVDPVSANAMVNGARLPLDRLAPIDQKSCGRDAQGAKLCPGAPISRNGERGLVLGAFADGTFAVSSKAGLVRLRGTELKLDPPEGDDLRQIVADVANINQIQDLVTKADWQDCSGMAYPPPPHLARAKDLSCDEPAGSVTGDDSPNKDKFQALLAKGGDAPISDFLTLWYPDDGDGLDRDSPYFACETAPRGYFNNVSDRCRPDILFSWGPQGKKDQVMKNLADGKDWTGIAKPNPPYYQIFSSISSAATFGYGPILLRFKVKAGAKYGMSGFGGYAIGVRQGEFHDFAIGDAQAIESVSYGTPEIYDEVVRDLLHWQAGKRVSIYTDYNEQYGNGGPGFNGLYNQAVDGHRMNESELKSRLLELIREILAGEGRINYAQGACRSRALTYSSSMPSYIEPVSTPKKR